MKWVHGSTINCFFAEGHEARERDNLRSVTATSITMNDERAFWHLHPYYSLSSHQHRDDVDIQKRRRTAQGDYFMTMRSKHFKLQIPCMHAWAASPAINVQPISIKDLSWSLSHQQAWCPAPRLKKKDILCSKLVLSKNYSFRRWSSHHVPRADTFQELSSAKIFPVHVHRLESTLLPTTLPDYLVIEQAVLQLSLGKFTGLGGGGAGGA
jgi:hypothetical protein